MLASSGSEAAEKDVPDNRQIITAMGSTIIERDCTATCDMTVWRKLCLCFIEQLDIVEVKDGPLGCVTDKADPR